MCRRTTKGQGPYGVSFNSDAMQRLLDANPDKIEAAFTDDGVQLGV